MKTGKRQYHRCHMKFLAVVMPHSIPLFGIHFGEMLRIAVDTSRRWSHHTDSHHIHSNQWGQISTQNHTDTRLLDAFMLSSWMLPFLLTLQTQWCWFYPLVLTALCVCSVCCRLCCVIAVADDAALLLSLLFSVLFSLCVPLSQSCNGFGAYPDQMRNKWIALSIVIYISIWMLEKGDRRIRRETLSQKKLKTKVTAKKLANIQIISTGYTFLTCRQIIPNMINDSKFTVLLHCVHSTWHFFHANSPHFSTYLYH